MLVPAEIIIKKMVTLNDETFGFENLKNVRFINKHWYCPDEILTNIFKHIKMLNWVNSTTLLLVIQII